MNYFILIFLFLIGCSSNATKKENLETQKAIIRSGISLKECFYLVNDLILSKDSCEELQAINSTSLDRSRKFVRNHPFFFRDRNIEEVVVKIADIFMQFPETDEEYLYNNFVNDLIK